MEACKLRVAESEASMGVEDVIDRVLSVEDIIDCIKQEEVRRRKLLQYCYSCGHKLPRHRDNCLYAKVLKMVSQYD